jgi:hypothetical protein
MSEDYQRIEVITGVARRRQWSTDAKLRIIEESFQPGETVSSVARRNGVAPNLLYRWSTADNFTARRHLEEAIRLDPNYVGAIAQLGISHYWDARFSVSLDGDRSLALAQEQADHAMALAPEAPIVHARLS